MSTARHMGKRIEGGAMSHGNWLPPLLCAAVTLSLMLVSTLCYQLPATCAAMFALVQLGGTACMGFLALRALGITKTLPSAADALALSYLLGYGVSLIAYVALFFLAPHELIGRAYLALSAIALLVCAVVVLREDRPGLDDPTPWCTIATYSTLLAILSLTFMLPNYLPTARPNSFYLDNIYWVGNNVELTYAIPPDNFRNVLAPDIRYHYLSSIRMALMQTVLDIPALQACFAYSFFDLATLLASSAVMFVREYSGDRGNGLSLPLVTFLLLFSTGFERITSMSFLSHLYVASFGFGESFAYMLAFLALAKRYWEQGSPQPQEALVSAVVLALCMGDKGTLGFVCLVVAFVLCLVSLFSRERRGFALLFGLSVLVAGLAMYFGILSEGIWRNVGEVSNVRSLLSFPRVRTAYEWVRALPLPRVLQEGIFLAGYAFACHPILYGLALVAFIQALPHLEVDVLDVALWVASALCLCILRLVHMKGFSQSYFYMATIPLMWGYVSRRLRVAPQLRERAAAVAMALAATLLTLSMCYQLWLPKLAAKSALHLVGAEMPESLLTMGGFNDNMVTPEAYSSLVWVRDNLPTDALYMTDVYDAAGSNTYYPGAIAQRHVITQWNLNEASGVEEDSPSVFEGDEGALRRCHEVGIGYLVQIVSSEPLEGLFPDSMDVIYRQDGVSVYRLR